MTEQVALFPAWCHSVSGSGADVRHQGDGTEPLEQKRNVQPEIEMQVNVSDEAQTCQSPRLHLTFLKPFCPVRQLFVNKKNVSVTSYGSFVFQQVCAETGHCEIQHIV